MVHDRLQVDLIARLAAATPGLAPETVLDKRLAEAEYLAGDYSVADIATFPWAARHEWQGIALEDFANVKRWYDAIATRPAVTKGMAVPG